MHLPAHEFLSRWTNFEIREMIALEKLKERLQLEEAEGRAGVMARARKLNRERKALEERID